MYYVIFNNSNSQKANIVELTSEFLQITYKLEKEQNVIVLGPTSRLFSIPNLTKCSCGNVATYMETGMIYQYMKQNCLLLIKTSRT